jgi:hypothetical protein
VRGSPASATRWRKCAGNLKSCSNAGEDNMEASDSRRLSGVDV